LTKSVVLNEEKIFLCAVLIYIFAMSPFVFKLSGELYILGAFVLGIGLLQKAFALLIARAKKDTIRLSEILVSYSVYYLPALFTLMLVDHYLYFGFEGLAGLSQSLL